MGRLALIGLLVGAILLGGCTSLPNDLGPEPSLESACDTEHITDCLTAMHDNAMQGASSEINELDEQISQIDEKIDALEEVIDRRDETIAYLNEDVQREKLETGAYWYFNLPADDYEYFESEYYELDEFSLKWYARVGEGIWELVGENVYVRDKETLSTGAPELMMNTLEHKRSSLTSDKTALSSTKEKAKQLLYDVVGHKDAWEITEISAGVYSVDGYGLGYYEEQLSIGTWYYYNESNKMEPRSSASIELKNILTAS